MYPDTQIPQVTSCVVPSSMGPFRNLAPISHIPTAVAMMSSMKPITRINGFPRLLLVSMIPPLMLGNTRSDCSPGLPSGAYDCE